MFQKLKQASEETKLSNQSKLKQSKLKGSKTKINKQNKKINEQSVQASLAYLPKQSNSSKES